MRCLLDFSNNRGHYWVTVTFFFSQKQGFAMASIRQVAKEAGVSIATVSRVMNGVETVDPELRKVVLRAVKACDYVPGGSRKTPESIALIYTGVFAVGSPYDSSCVEGMVDPMRASNYDLIVVDIQRDKSPQETLRQFFSRKGIMGAIVRSTADQRTLVREMASEGLPLVILGDHFACENVSFIYADSKTASRDAVQHLVTLGHKRIAFAACEREDGDHLDRLLAYRDVLNENRILDESLICRVPPHRLDGAQLLQNLLSKPDRPTAIFIADPLVAIGAMNEAHRLGVRIPEDLSIVGFDDSDTRNMVYPRMTAVCQDSRHLGQLAFEEVLKINDPKNHHGPKLDAQQAWFEIGNSTAPPTESAESILPTGKRLN